MLDRSRRRAAAEEVHAIERLVQSVAEALEPRRLLSTYTVTNLNDSGAGSLREAIDEANSKPGSDTISFASGLGGTITLGGSQLEISDDLTISGPGASVLTVSGTSASRVFENDSTANVEILGLTITQGDSHERTGGGILNSGTLSLNACTVSDSSANLGGGIANTGSLTITRSTISSNSANENFLDSGGRAGGIFNAGTMSISASTISDNVSSNVGAIYNTGSLRITNSTISRNSAANVVGGIENDGAAAITSSSVSQNSSDGDTGGVFVVSGSLALNDCIVAGNFRRGDASPADIDAAIDASRSGFNLIGTGFSGGLMDGADGNIVGVADPMLAPLGNYGGPTQTMPPLPGSPAINAGSNPLAIGPDGKPLVTDQRGYARRINGTVDIGAVEYGSSPLQPGDADGDGVVDFADLLILTQNYGKTSGVSWSDGDFNYDGTVNFDDLLLLAQNYGRPLPLTPAPKPPSAPPSPVAIVNS